MAEEYGKMKVLSLTQPWASLVCLGAKHNETRSWYTRYRGPLLIHASKSYPGWAKQLERREPFYSALRPHHCYSYPELACGKIIGQVELVDCCSVEALHNFGELNEDEREFGDYSANRYVWLLEQPRFLPQPIPAKGALGLWEFEMPTAELAVRG